MIIKRTEENGIINALYESSNILSSKYDGKDLTIIFKRGASYTYNNVSRSDYTRFEMADSQGSVMNKYIKQYPFSRNDDANETEIINQINETKAETLKNFEIGLIKLMDDIVSNYNENSNLEIKSINGLTEMIIKYNELNGSTSPLKLCKCD